MYFGDFDMVQAIRGWDLNVNVTTLFPSMSSICLSYLCTFPPKDINKLLLVTCGMLVIVRRKWMSGTNCLIQVVPDVLYWGLIQGICGQIMHTGVFVIQKLSSNTGELRSGSVVLENDVFLANQGQDYRFQYLVAESDSIQITNNDIKWRVMSLGWSHPKQTSW